MNAAVVESQNPEPVPPKPAETAKPAAQPIENIPPSVAAGLSELMAIAKGDPELEEIVRGIAQKAA